MVSEYPDYICSTQGYKKRKLKDLTVEEKLDIVEDVQIKKDYHENICSRYKIGRESIKTLLKNIKRDACYLRKLESKRIAKHNKKEIVLEQITKNLDQDQAIGSIKEIKREVVDQTGLEISNRLISDVVKTSTNLKFKKMKRIPMHANSLRNQYMRQQFALKMLDLLQSGKRIIAVDESWFGETNYTR